MRSATSRLRKFLDCAEHIHHLCETPAVPVWDLHLVKDIRAIESVQRFAAKVCTIAWRGVDHKDRLSMLNLTTLETRWTILKHCFLYKECDRREWS